jgi:hypothetical protein
MAKVGDKRSNGTVEFTVVAVDAKHVYVKRSEESKKALAEREGSYPVSRSEFDGWTETGKK